MMMKEEKEDIAGMISISTQGTWCVDKCQLALGFVNILVDQGHRGLAVDVKGRARLA